MKPLPENFTLHKHGIDVRLAQIEDSAFILALRNSKRGQMLHATENDLQKQIEWMKEYKKREKECNDYYFIYFFNDEPIGVNRVYDIKPEEKSCVTGSWVIKEGVSFEVSMRTMLILRGVVFETLELEVSYGDTKKTNKHMQRLYKMLGIEQIGETEDEYLYKSIKSKYKQGNEKILKLIGVS